MIRLWIIGPLFALLFLTSVLAANHNCLINSSYYSRYTKEDHKVRLKEGSLISISTTETELISASVDGEKFSNCHKEIFKIENITMAKNLFQHTGETNFKRFIGLKVGMCRKANKGWMLTIGKENSYLSYMGSSDIALSLVGCTKN